MSRLDYETESLLTFPQASKSIPGNPSVATLHRWANKGLQGIKLETAKFGGKRFTSKEALDRFFENTSSSQCGESENRRLPQRDRVDQELDSEGF